MNWDDLARLSDSELRALMMERMAEEEAPPATPSMSITNPVQTAMSLESMATQARTRLGEVFSAYPLISKAMASGWSTVTMGQGWSGLGEFGFHFGLAIVLGWGTAFLLRRRLEGRISGEGEWTFQRKVVHFVGFLFSRVLSILIFSAIATLCFFMSAGAGSEHRTTFAFYLLALVIIWLIDSVCRAYLRPGASERRIPDFSDGEAKRIYWSLATTVGIGAFLLFSCALLKMFGTTGDVYTLLVLIVGVIIATGLCLTFLVNGSAFVQDLGGHMGEGRLGTARRTLARAYPWSMTLGTLVLLGVLVFMSVVGKWPPFGAAPGTIGLLLLFPSLDAAAKREGMRAKDGGDEVVPAVVRVSRIALAVGGVAALAGMWGINPLTGSGMMMSESLQATVVKTAIQIGLIVLLAYAAWQALRIWVDRRVAEEDAARREAGLDPAEGEIGGTGLSRARTLLPLVKRLGQATVAVITLMVVLSTLGLDIGPLLAGAGVVGLAVGFGSQTLVRDIVSGAFFLMDDAFRLGEYVDLGTVKGSVERIAIRSLQLRHHRGALHTVPFGEIQTLTNYSRDWAIMKLRFRLPFDTDTERARKIIKGVGQRLMDHPEVGEDFLQPFKSQGVVEVDDYGLVLSTKFMCKPGRQFLIRRYAFAEVQKAFAENGIAFARPEIRVSLGGEEREKAEADPALAQAVGAAALTADQARKSLEGPAPSTV